MMTELNSNEVELVTGGMCGPMTSGDIAEGALVYGFTGIIGLAIWYKSYKNACT